MHEHEYQFGSVGYLCLTYHFATPGPNVGVTPDAEAELESAVCGHQRCANDVQMEGT